jgi:acetyl-CoA carboxylase beta subunit
LTVRDSHAAAAGTAQPGVLDARTGGGRVDDEQFSLVEISQLSVAVRIGALAEHDHLRGPRHSKCENHDLI